MNNQNVLSDIFPLAIKNPSREVVKRLLSLAAGVEVRGVIDHKTCDVFVWEITEATHKQVGEKMNWGLIDHIALFRLNSSEQMDKIIVWS